MLTASNPTRQSPWRKQVPVASLEQQIQILAVAETIADSLWASRRSLSPDLCSGLAGAALYLGCLSGRPGFDHLKERSRDMLNLAVDQAWKAPSPSLYGGFVGLAWTLEHLMRHQVFSGDGEGQEDLNSEVDEILLERLAAEPGPMDYDLVGGWVGVGVYALERLPRATGRRLLEGVLDRLEALAIPRSPGLAWPTPPEALPAWQREQCPRGYLNLGLAHGVPGVLCLLASMAAVGLAPARAEKLLAGGLAWFRTQFQPPRLGSYLAGWCPRERDRAPGASTRIAWCYGDLGASMALWNVARLAPNATLEAQALKMARFAAARPLEASGVVDAGLCHGSAGNLHMFHRLYRATGETAFLVAARNYLGHALASHRPGTGFAGFSAYRPPLPRTLPGTPPGTPHGDAAEASAVPGLLEGAAGVGLALISILEGIDMSWDRLLLLSTPFTPHPTPHPASSARC